MIHRRLAFSVCLLLGTAFAQVTHRITVNVVDENGVAVSDARIVMTATDGSQTIRCQTGPAGICYFTVVARAPVRFRARVEKENFYATQSGDLSLEGTREIELTLAHQREVRETVDVVESTPAINPEQIQAQEQISGVDVINLPYPVTRDYRNVLNYIPQVVNDVTSQPHITGAETYQSLVLLDGFNVTQPANGQLLMRISTDAFRSIQVQTSRVSAEYGKGSGGLLQLNTASGDDRFRFATTDFIPSLQNKNGWTFDKWNPRFSFSGPIQKGRAWFYDAIDGEYDNIIEPALAPPNHDTYWRIGNLAKVQGNVTPRNILTAGFNFNHDHDQHNGISLQSPPSSTPTLSDDLYQGSLKDQYYFPSGHLLETGFGFNRYNMNVVPNAATGPFFIDPNQSLGTYYFTADTAADRWQIYSNLFVKAFDWHGNHQFKFGIDIDRLRYDFNFQRQPISYLNDVPTQQNPPPPNGCIPQNGGSPDPRCVRYSQFAGPSASELHNSELSGYGQDRWLITNRFLVEAGLRYDWDEVIRKSLVSPRLAGTYVLNESGNTKLSAGIGVFYDSTPLFLIARPAAGTRIDTFYFPTFSTGPITSMFSVDRTTLDEARYLNWSLGLEQKLPGQVYLKAEFIQKHGHNGLAYNWVNPIDLSMNGVCTPQSPCNAQFQLENQRNDHFDSFEINLRRVFEKGYLLMGSYIRSKSTTSQVLDFNIDNPVFSTQQPGPYPWDAPNRFLSWGFLPLPSLPLIHKLDFAYSTEVRSGFPFYLVDNQQQLASFPKGGPVPQFMRFPTYFTLNTHIEKRFHFLGFYWALRGGFDNVTGRKNFQVVNNNVDSQQRFEMSGFTGRAFTGRIRFLGRK